MWLAAIDCARFTALPWPGALAMTEQACRRHCRVWGSGKRRWWGHGCKCGASCRYGSMLGWQLQQQRGQRCMPSSVRSVACYVMLCWWPG